MSPETIHSLIEIFGVEKGLHILNLFTAMDDTTIRHSDTRPNPRANLKKGKPKRVRRSKNPQR